MAWSAGPMRWLASKGRMRRRGLVLLASSVVAGQLSRVAESPSDRVALAANNDPVLAGNTVNATLPTQINGSGSATFVATNAGGIGVAGYSASQTGTLGQSSSGVGVFGTTTDASGVFGGSVNAPGVSGFSTNNVGVQGSSNVSNGVLGVTGSNVGVFGDA